MQGHGGSVVRAHADSVAQLAPGPFIGRQQREEEERQQLREGAALSCGAGDRRRPEEPDPERTCFERDRDRIVHSPAFRRLAGKTQVVVYPTDHQRTRLTHAIEVAQIARSIARGCGANAVLADAIALGHDCGHGPGGHAAEEAFDAFLPDGYDHGPWGADVALTSLNLCSETLDGIRNHSWSRPAPSTIEGEIVSWSDRIGYCAHDFEDAVHAGIVASADLPQLVTQSVGTTRSGQLRAFIEAVVETVCRTGKVGMPADIAEALAALRRFNYERIYTRPESMAQSLAVIEVLRGLVSWYLDHPDALPEGYWDQEDPPHGVISYVSGMTDRFAFDQAVELLGWNPARLPKGIGHGA
jgi:dGTPase